MLELQIDTRVQCDVTNVKTCHDSSPSNFGTIFIRVCGYGLRHLPVVFIRLPIADDIHIGGCFETR
jgi:hypothetical protein